MDSVTPDHFSKGAVMHEHSLVAGLIGTIESIANEHGGKKVAGVRIRLGALSQMSGSHFRGHFLDAARGTAAEGADLEIEEMTDVSSPDARHIVLESVELEQ
jgi:hydrogenase nickel incorporation protein HypA/HybF